MAVQSFALNEPEDVILQAYEKDFEDYVDIEDGDVLPGPAKVRVVLKQTVYEEPVKFLPVSLNFPREDVENQQTSSVK